jgi:hypothetical protein
MFHTGLMLMPESWAAMSLMKLMATRRFVTRMQPGSIGCFSGSGDLEL